MGRYQGRTTQGTYTKNFGGLNTVASIMNGQTNEASDISSWDIDLSGAITRRLGHATKYTFGADVRHLDTFFKLDGSQVYLAVSGGNVYEASAPTGPWTNRGGSLTTGDFSYIGTDLNGQYVLCNGVDKPIVFIPGTAVQTLEDASLLQPPTNLAGTRSATGTKTYKYVITSLTPRGESLASDELYVYNAPSTLTSSNYITLSWTPMAGAFTQNIYQWNATTSTYDRLAVVTGTANSYTDNGAVALIFEHPPTVNTAYNTPEDWNTNGQPEGVFVVARGKNQRMVAWRQSFYWFCALSNIYDWYTTSDSFSRYNLGGQDNNIKAATTIYDYTVFFSKTNSFVYSGSSDSDWALEKILNTGCQSHYAITHVGDEAILWSQFGPTTVQRILSGQDVSTTSVGQKISNVIYDETNLDEWEKIRSWHDIKNHRVCFAVPGSGETKNTFCLVFNYQTKGWTRFDGWQVENIAYDPIAKVNYASINGNTIVQLHTGYTDSGVSIGNSYTTHFDDAGTDMKKRDMMIDVTMDATNPYTVTVKTQLGYDSTNVETHTLSYDGTTATTDGQAIVDQANLAHTHRIVTVGYADAMRLEFSDTNNSYPAKILGWRPDYRIRGIR